jgi:hypothetical protein
LQLCDEAASQLWQDGHMARKKKVKKFTRVSAVKALARERVGAPPTSQIVPDRRKKKDEKHKPTLEKLIEENFS